MTQEPVEHELLLQQYFPALSARQREQFELLGKLYPFWNARINLVSRKDLDHLFEHHILHSLAIAKFIQWTAGTRVMDVGTGGGFPGIPLAVYFPEVSFLLVESVGKKAHAADAIASAAGLNNVTVLRTRAEDLFVQVDFIVSRAVASLDVVYRWTRNHIASGHRNVMQNGWIILKGGTLESEITALKEAWGSQKGNIQIVPVSQYYNGAYFKGKQIVYFTAGQGER